LRKEGYFSTTLVWFHTANVYIQVHLNGMVLEMIGHYLDINTMLSQIDRSLIHFCRSSVELKFYIQLKLKSINLKTRHFDVLKLNWINIVPEIIVLQITREYTYQIFTYQT